MTHMRSVLVVAMVIDGFLSQSCYTILVLQQGSRLG